VQAQKRNPSVRSIQRASMHCVSTIPSDCVTAGRFLSICLCGNDCSSERPAAAAAAFKPPQTLRSPVLAWRSVARAMPTEARACVAGA